MKVGRMVRGNFWMCECREVVVQFFLGREVEVQLICVQLVGSLEKFWFSYFSFFRELELEVKMIGEVWEIDKKVDF